MANQAHRQFFESGGIVGNLLREVALQPVSELPHHCFKLGTNGNKTPGILARFCRRSVGNTGVQMVWAYLGRKRSAVRIRAPRP